LTISKLSISRLKAAVGEYDIVWFCVFLAVKGRSEFFKGAFLGENAWSFSMLSEMAF
jgi:hypothetical protein